MPRMAKRKRNQSAMPSPAFLRVVRAHAPKTLTPDIAEHFNRYRETKDKAAFQAILLTYAPLAWVEAWKFHQRHGERFNETLDYAVSDGILGLILAIDRAVRTRTEHLFYFRAGRYAFKAMWRQATQRQWGSNTRRARDSSIARNIRAAHVAEHGYAPTPEEMSSMLAGLVDNPNFEVSHHPKIRSTTMLARRTVDPMPFPDELLMDRETIKLAMKGLKSQDKAILKRVMAGDGPAEIGRDLGLSRCGSFRRVSGVLWEARCRADLARHLGVEPASPTDRNKAVLASMKNIAPARMVS